MTDIVRVASGIPGSGKTESFISTISADEDVLLVLPTKALTKDVVKRLRDKGIESYVINSDYYPAKVKNTVEDSLTELKYVQGGCVVIITHQTLTNIDPAVLNGWKVVVDEVPAISNTHQKGLGINLFKDSFDHLVTWNEDGVVQILDGKLHEVMVRKAEAGVDSAMSIQSLVFGALLKPKAEVCIDIKEEGSSLKYYIKVIDHHDYKSIIENSNEFHVMGNAVENSLFYKYIKANGFKTKLSEYTPAFREYNKTPTLVPLFKGDRFSKTMLHTRNDGTDSLTFDSDCLGYKAIQRALDYIGDNNVLVQVHTWVAFPFSDYDNVEVTPFDARGLNTYTSHNHTLNLAHGNPNTIEDQMNVRMLEMMGVDIAEGKAAIRYERSIESMVQHIARTSIRTFQDQEQATVHIIPTLADAKEIERALRKKCSIDSSIMIDVPATPNKAAKEVQINKAVDMLATGMKKKDIAAALSISRPTLNNWLKAA